MYRRAHIDGAIGILEHHYIKQPGYAEDARKHPLVMPPEPFAELMGQMAIGNDTTVIAYDSFGSLWAARFGWVLSYYRSGFSGTNTRMSHGAKGRWI